jgi:small conductance mechanosensitive channel
MGDQLQALDQVRSTAIDLGMKFGPKLFVAILVLVAGYVAGRWAARAADRMLARLQLEPPVRRLIGRAVQVLVLGLFVIIALQNLGVELLPLIAGLGVAGAGVALAMQGVLGNAAAGFTIIFTRPFRVGDYISIAKEEGEVLDISLFTTVLGHADLSRVVIPNRKIVGEILHNYGKLRQLGIEVGVGYDADLGAALRALREVLQANPRVLKDPAPGINVLRLADSQIAIGVNPWVNVPDFIPAIGELNEAILEIFRTRGIVMPYPQLEVRMLPGTA